MKKPNLLRSRDGKLRVFTRQPGCQQFECNPVFFIDRGPTREGTMNKLKIFLAVFLLAPAFLILADNPARAALNAYLILADGQGNPIEGECVQAGREGTTEIYAFGHNIHIPYDPASGIPTGPKTHTPLQIYKAVDKISPLLNQVMVANEVLTKFELDFWRSNAQSGGEEKYFRIILEKAKIVKITPSMANNRITENMPLQVAETVSFTYSSITWESLLPAPGVAKSDTWVSQ